MSERSHVGMSQCFYCNKAKDVLLHRRMSKVLPQSAVYDLEPCGECESLMERGIILIGATEDSLNKLEAQRAAYEQKVHSQKVARTSRRSETPMPFIPNPYRTGHWFVVSDDFVKRAFDESVSEGILKCRWAFITEDIAKWLDEGHKRLQENEQTDTGES